jgi:hypothetical protein
MIKLVDEFKAGNCDDLASYALNEVLKQMPDGIAAVAQNMRINQPLLKFEWVRWWWGASGGRGQGRAKPGAANP